MNGGRGPEILGVCEVENEYVMQLLVHAPASLVRNYAVAHHDLSDNRGIDLGFIYDADLFSPETYPAISRCAVLESAFFSAGTSRLKRTARSCWSEIDGFRRVVIN